MSLPTSPNPPEDPLPRKAAAIELLRHHGDVTRRHQRTRTALVDASRDAGLSWVAIGNALREHPETIRVAHLRERRREEPDDLRQRATGGDCNHKARMPPGHYCAKCGLYNPDDQEG